MINLEEKIVIRLNQLGKYFVYFSGIESKKINVSHLNVKSNNMLRFKFKSSSSLMYSFCEENQAYIFKKFYENFLKKQK